MSANVCVTFLHYRMLWLIGTAVLGFTHAFSMQAQLTTCASLLESPQLQFEQALEDVEASYGDSVTLLCSIYGAPQAAITWYHRGRVVASYSAPSVESAVHTTRIASGLIETRYTIPCVNRKTIGEYTCQASSPCGEVISSNAIVALSNAARGVPNSDLGPDSSLRFTQDKRFDAQQWIYLILIWGWTHIEII
ncbi:hypothetical protein Y032_0277g1126 [Ancylostoma ceylanicum]|uniref:Ig-like domain-containing protein n=1 Tax=Ancylostoma ceylanicum TaxID=53326 RepID=A0A016S7H9_9BILA|nr:hypothetical protein Y032_0277g1126 [Ancylostoma ceylanicum]